MLVQQHNTDSVTRKIASGILVGGQDANFCFLDENIWVLLKNRVSPSNVEQYVHNYRSFFNPVHGVAGVLYSSGDAVLFENSTGRRQVGIIENCFVTSVNNKPERYVVVNLYPFVTENGDILIDKYSGHKVVKSSITMVLLRLCEIKRLIMLYRVDQNKLVAIDYNRKTLPLSSIQRPFFPVLDDVVAVNLEEGEWYAHIISIFVNKKQVKIKYMKENLDDVQYLKHIEGRNAVDVISWDAIVRLIVGSWDSRKKTFHMQNWLIISY